VYHVAAVGGYFGYAGKQVKTSDVVGVAVGKVRAVAPVPLTPSKSICEYQFPAVAAVKGVGREPDGKVPGHPEVPYLGI
jgi:hypothetical protein